MDLTNQTRTLTEQRFKELVVSMTWSLIDWFKLNTDYSDQTVAKHVAKILNDFESRYQVSSQQILDEIRTQQASTGFVGKLNARELIEYERFKQRDNDRIIFRQWLAEQVGVDIYEHDESE